MRGGRPARLERAFPSRKIAFTAVYSSREPMLVKPCKLQKRLSFSAGVMYRSFSLQMLRSLSRVIAIPAPDRMLVAFAITPLAHRSPGPTLGFQGWQPSLLGWEGKLAPLQVRGHEW
jgi:hypothetical protein